MSSDKIFLGRGWSFPPSFSKATNELVMVADEDDIRQSLDILLSTTIGERFLQPRYGCNLQHYVFEPMDATIQTLIKLTVRDAITVFEPRIKLLGVKLDNSMLVEGRIDIAIEYIIRATNSRFNLVYPFYITEANTKTA